MFYCIMQYQSGLIFITKLQISCICCQMIVSIVSLLRSYMAGSIFTFRITAKWLLKWSVNFGRIQGSRSNFLNISSCCVFISGSYGKVILFSLFFKWNLIFLLNATSRDFLANSQDIIFKLIQLAFISIINSI